MKAYSQDLRQRVLRAVDHGHTQDEIRKTFAISVATIKRYLKQQREGGHVLSTVATPIQSELPSCLEMEELLAQSI